jgi:hypothetical protein
MRTIAAPLIDTVATLLHDLPDAAIDALLPVAGPAADSPPTLTELRQLGGAYGRPAAHPSAFCYRDAAYNLFVSGRPAEADGQRLAEHANEVIAALEPWSTGGMLPNFADAGDPRTTQHRYDAATLIRLSAGADRYDPAGILWGRPGHSRLLG